LRPAQTKSSGDPISKTTRTKWTGGVAQAAEYLLCKCEALSSEPNPNHHPPSKKRKRLMKVEDLRTDSKLSGETEIFEKNDLKSMLSWMWWHNVCNSSTPGAEARGS
jgi:hypothetical protein